MGADPAGVIDSAGLDPAAFQNPEGTIPFRSAGRLLELAAERTACPHFGLELSKLVTFSNLGLPGQLMRNAPTVRAALRAFAALQHRNSNGGMVYLIEGRTQAMCGYAIYAPNIPGHALITDTAANSIFTTVRTLLQNTETKLEVFLTRPAPLNLTPYQEAFQRTPHFGAVQTAVRIPKAALDNLVPGADPILFEQLQKSIRLPADIEGPTLEADLRRRIRLSLLTGQVSATRTAAELGMNTRMLSRRLQPFGVTFQTILNETRTEFVKQLLANTRLEIGDIARIVGYADASVLTRRFLTWTGVTPSVWRKQSSVRTAV